MRHIPHWILFSPLPEHRQQSSFQRIDKQPVKERVQGWPVQSVCILNSLGGPLSCLPASLHSSRIQILQPSLLPSCPPSTKTSLEDSNSGPPELSLNGIKSRHMVSGTMTKVLRLQNCSEKKNESFHLWKMNTSDLATFLPGEKWCTWISKHAHAQNSSLLKRLRESARRRQLASWEFRKSTPSGVEP
jgi:hypothetical protein